MGVWKRAATPEEVNARLSAAGASAVFGIRVTAILPDAVRAEMTIGPQHLQPHGIVHGGVSVVLAETLGTLACILALPEGQHAVGIEVNANHLAVMRPGEIVTAECRPLHTGRRTQVWQTEIRRADGRLACVSRLTCAVLAGDEPG
ncbi:MAG TPA: hotdog fold thioesterase [Falsiroseomonas sp.]|jgi:1,4-dihydroxy-2-naphthoyl-CoA hydrolase|nr:hotdog fold thioesterase [Falsiroseomonas sp.]